MASGTPSSAIALAVGSNVITTVVTAQDGTTTKTYTITVTRAASNVTTLSNLVVSAGALSPSFTALTTSYTVSVANATTSTTVTPTLTDSNAVVRVNGVIVSSGTASSAIALNVGANVITTLVTAQDGVSTRTYTITVTRAPSNNANLSNLVASTGALTPVFSSATTSYTISVPNTTTSMTVTPTVTNAFATVKVNTVTVASGSPSSGIALNVGANVITTVVTAQDGTTTRTYTITVTRAPAASASIVNLKLYVEGYYLGSGLMKSVKFNQDGVSDASWVQDCTVELRHATTFALVATTTATLKTDGSMACTFNTAPSGSFYIAVSGGNMVRTWSATPQIVGNTPLTYDFSNVASKAYDSNAVQVGAGVWAFYSGDINQDGVVDGSDSTNLLNDIQNAASGVLVTDINGDGVVNNSDTTVYIINTQNAVFSHHP